MHILHSRVRSLKKYIVFQLHRPITFLTVHACNSPHMFPLCFLFQLQCRTADDTEKCFFHNDLCSESCNRFDGIFRSLRIITHKLTTISLSRMTVIKLLCPLLILFDCVHYHVSSSHVVFFCSLVNWRLLMTLRLTIGIWIHTNMHSLCRPIEL